MGEFYVKPKMFVIRKTDVLLGTLHGLLDIILHILEVQIGGSSSSSCFLGLRVLLGWRMAIYAIY